eukprot:4192223-Prymnesium_polylepis.1
MRRRLARTEKEHMLTQEERPLCRATKHWAGLRRHPPRALERLRRPVVKKEEEEEHGVESPGMQCLVAAPIAGAA